MKELAVYFENGNVAYFKQVEHFVESATEISFNYFGQASQRNRHATFSMGSIAGYSITTD